MDLKNIVVTCNNCGVTFKLTPSILREIHIESIDDKGLVATYIECPTCGEKMLKQIDNPETLEIKDSVVKLKLRQRACKKLSDKQKTRLLKLDKKLDNIRKVLNDLYWDEVYQYLNK